MEIGLKKNKSIYNTKYFNLLFSLTFYYLQAQNKYLKNKKYLNIRIETRTDRVSK